MMKKLFVTLICVLALLSVSAQNTADTVEVLRQRPKVGVVLSGGGAKGFAHIGALKVIEEAGIPIDYVAGTSMGSIVGGLYAVGYDPDMMKKLATEQNWERILKDEMPRKFMPIEKRVDDRHYLLSLPYKDGKFKIKRSMVDGVYVNMLLTRLTMPAYKNRDFSTLPVPFLCIGTDMITADPIEFRSGSLAQAIRSSMSIPFLFEPVEYDDYLLCDGGLTNNFPVRNVREHGADIIIGVDLEIIKSEHDILDNSLKVLERLIAVVSQDESNKAREECDILIRPDIGNANILSFNDFGHIIKGGEQGAREKWPELKRLADSLQAIAPFEVEHHHTQPVDSIYVNDVVVTGVDENDGNILKSEFGKEFPRMFSIDEIETIVVRIYSQGYYSNVWYEILDTPEGNILNFHCKHNTSLTFSTGLHYDNNYGIGALFNLSGKFRRVSFGLDLNVSDNPYVRASVIGRNKNVLRFGADIYCMNLKFNFYDRGNILGVLRFQHNSLDLHTQIVPTRTQYIKLGAVANYGITEDKISLFYDELDYKFEYELYPYLYFHYFFNNEDKTDFAQKGWHIDVLGKCVFYDGVFEKEESKPVFSVQANLGRSFAIGQRHSLKLGLVGATRLGTVMLPDPFMFFVGGQSKMKYMDNIISFAGLRFVNRMVENAAFAKTAWQWNFYRKFYGIVNSDFGYFTDFLFDEDGYDIEKWFDSDNFVMGAGLTLGMKTLFGPIEIGVSKSNIDRDPVLFVNVGYWF